MEKHLEESLIQSLEAKPELLRFLPELLVDLWALGSKPETILELVSTLNLNKEAAKILDLGCGKGAVAVTLAKNLGLKVKGIDAFKPFLEIAIQKAEEYKVEHLCKFVLGDLRESVKTEKDYDLVSYISLGSILGGFDEIVKKLRNTVKIGGYILIDDGFLKTDTPVNRAGYELYFSYEDTIKKLTSSGDKIVREYIYPEEQTRELNLSYQRMIEKRSEEIIERHPSHAKEIREYVANQKEECEVIDKRLTGALWILEKR
ncbi:MAG: methyltransferase domain-containing protein [bacterium]